MRINEIMKYHTNIRKIFYVGKVTTSRSNIDFHSPLKTNIEITCDICAYSAGHLSIQPGLGKIIMTHCYDALNIKLKG